MKTCTGGRIGSSGEVRIKETLEAMHIKYEYNTSYKVKSPIGAFLRWDFIIFHNSEKHFIEYDGRQHSEPVAFGGMSKEQAEANFEKQKVHDEIKNKYCADNGYQLLRISYLEYENTGHLIADFARKYLNWGVE